MRTVVLGELPAELEALIANRRATGADLHDEVWEGEYHMAPMANGEHAWLQGSLSEMLRRHAGRVGMFAITAFNLGDVGDFRIPDLGVFRRWAGLVWYPTAALVVEIVSPDDESWQKFGFYAAHDVDEIVIVDPCDHSVAWFALADGEYRTVERSAVLDVDVADIAAAIDWPPRNE